MKRILVIGPESYLGRHIVEYLNLMSADTIIETMGIQTIPLFRDRYHHWYRNKEEKPFLPDHYDVVVYNHDIRTMDKNFDKNAYQPNINDKDMLHTVVDTEIVWLYESLHNLKYDNFIFISDIGGYRSESYYFVIKQLAEQTVAHYCKTHKKEYTIFRIFDLIGYKNFLHNFMDNIQNINKKLEYTRHHNLYTFHEKSNFTKDLTVAKDYVHILEACEAIRKACLQPTRHIENLCYGEWTTEKELLHLFVEANKLEYPNVEFKFVAKQTKVNNFYEPSALLERKYTKHDWVRIRENYNTQKALDFHKINKL